jgi:hypothetical protein
MTDLWATSAYQNLTLSRDGTALTGAFDGDDLVGGRSGDTLHSRVIDASGTATSRRPLWAGS